MHFTGAVASLFAGYITQRCGRTTSMIVAGTAYIAGSILQVVNSYLKWEAQHSIGRFNKIAVLLLVTSARLV